jgi:hypothetical protein
MGQEDLQVLQRYLKLSRGDVEAVYWQFTPAGSDDGALGGQYTSTLTINRYQSRKAASGSVKIAMLLPVYRMEVK